MIKFEDGIDLKTNLTTLESINFAIAVKGINKKSEIEVKNKDCAG